MAFESSSCPPECDLAGVNITGYANIYGIYIMVTIQTVGYYRIAAGVSSVWVSSWGVICKRVCLVMFLKGVGGDEPSHGLSLYVELRLAPARQGRALQGHCDAAGHAGRSQAMCGRGRRYGSALLSQL